MIMAATLAIYFLPARRTKTNQPFLWKSRLSRVKRIQIVHQRSANLSIVKQGRRWDIAKPFRCEADRQRIQTILSLLRSHVLRSYPVGSLSLHSVGLSSPSLTLVVNNKPFEFGALNPVTTLRYVQVGNKVDLISDMLYIELDHPPGYYASHRLVQFPLVTEHLREIQYPNVTLKSDGSRWDYVSPDRAHRLPPAERLAKAWETMRARRVFPMPTHGQRGDLHVAIEASGQTQSREQFVAKILSSGAVVLTAASRNASYLLSKSEAQELDLRGANL